MCVFVCLVMCMCMCVRVCCVCAYVYFRILLSLYYGYLKGFRHTVQAQTGVCAIVCVCVHILCLVMCVYVCVCVRLYIFCRFAHPVMGVLKAFSAKYKAKLVCMRVHLYM
jgi:hypothetical protein